MKVLFVMCRDYGDVLASCLWDGLQELLGEENVVDAVGHRWLHADAAGERVYRGHRPYRFGDHGSVAGISGRREGRTLDKDESGFDLMVLNACTFREYDWGFVRSLLPRLRPGSPVLYAEGWDSAHEVHPPAIPVARAFRKEIDPGRPYPYQCKHLTFAAPARWFDGADLDAPRPFDVFYSGTTHSHGCRWDAFRGLFAGNPHKSLVATKHMEVSVPNYFGYYRRSKIAFCPASAESADSLRTYEAVACGAIPLFVGYPPWRREGWFTGEHCFQCSWDSGDVARHVDIATDPGRDLRPMRAALLAFARERHTTLARAKTLLEGFL